MNKKLFALMMVPVVVVMGGTFAFSAWSGSANAFFGQSAATVGYTETLSFVHTNATHNPLSISFDGNAVNSNINKYTGSYKLDQKSGGAAAVLNEYVNVSNLVPGDYAEFQVIITNTGTATLNVSSVQWYGGAAYNGANQKLSAPSPITDLQPPVGPSYLNNVVTNGIPAVGATGLFYLFNATTTGSTPGYLTQGQSVTYNVYAILPGIANPDVAGTSFHFEVSIPVSTVQ